VLTLYTPHSTRTEQAGATPAPLWLDLCEPEEAERAHAERLAGVALPTREDVGALGLSNRLRLEKDCLRLDLPSFARAEDGQGASTPLAFLLMQDRLVSIRYAQSPAFDIVAGTFDKATANYGSVDLFVDLIETIVEVDADRMQTLSTDLSEWSLTVFSDSLEHRRQLRGALFKVGVMQRQINQIRSTLLGVSRILTYLRETAPPWFNQRARAQLKTIQTDIGALGEYNQQLSDRLQFLLDAVLGFLNNDQNDIMKVLTAVSVATAPPMILAGIWGMNFKGMPELDWPHGYAFGLAMIGLSTLLPLIWLRWKKWF
jgi:magnesium transporter